MSLMFEFHFIFSRNLILVFVDLKKKIHPWWHENFEVLKFFIYAWIVTKFALNDKAIEFSWFPINKLLIFFSEIRS